MKTGRRRSRQAARVPQTTPASRSAVSDLAAVVGLAALQLFVYSAVVRFGFVNWDDPEYVLNNEHVRAGLSWANVWWALTTAHTPYWHPLTWMSHMLDVSLFGVDAGPHHAINFVIATLNSVLVYVILRQATGAIGRSLVVAALFVVHPLHVESVAWITERKDLLSTLFLCLTILAYIRYVRAPGVARYLLVLAMFVLALMAKPMVVTLPILLLLFDVWPLGRLRWDAPPPDWIARIKEKAPLLALSAATAVVTIVIQSDVGAMADLESLGVAPRLATAIVGYAAYVRLTFWPIGLAAFYPPVPPATWVVAAAALMLAAITVAAVYWRRSHPFVLAGWLWFVIGLLPVSGLLQAGDQAYADRFMYVPILGPLFIVVWGLAAIAQRRPALTQVLGPASALAVGTLAVLARAQTATWADSRALWEHALAVTDNNNRAHEKLAEALRDAGEYSGARTHYEHAIALSPRASPRYIAQLRNGIGVTYAREGRPAEAISALRTAVALDGRFAEARLNLANALAQAGDAAGAENEFREVVRLDPTL
ncbi:MAG TPA: tetratricopeptide repeat protein, partial [Vicinamibacterales bacterium]|nr:tetratricopeptide repeat protein [Vicinamibacterales bacterium]